MEHYPGRLPLQTLQHPLTAINIFCDRSIKRHIWSSEMEQNTGKNKGMGYLGGKVGNVLFNDALNTFYLRLYGFKKMVNDHSESERETCCRHYMGYSFLLAERVLLYAPFHIQDSTYHSFCYTSRIAGGTRNSSMGQP